jgi:peptidoglycan/LPS O-acetylase OafA/YrhL
MWGVRTSEASKAAIKGVLTWGVIWRRGLTLALPLTGARNEIRALDGVRALAALSIVAYHTLLMQRIDVLALNTYGTLANEAINYLATGVQLFFILSGFLLFRPYAQAILDGRPIMDWRRFYRRRVLRILPAYYVTLGIVALTTTQAVRSPVWLNILSHVAFLHDMFPRFNRDLDGPFWPLAVEWQFYLLLPLIAVGLAWLARGAHPFRRLLAGLLLFTMLALAMHWCAVLLAAHLPADAYQHGGVLAAAWICEMLIFGTQGKFLEVFAVGMLCAALYVAVIERQMLAEHTQRLLAICALGGGVLATVVALPHAEYAEYQLAPGVMRGQDVILFPLVVGLAYGGLILGILLGAAGLRGPFTWGPLRFVGQISYSLYRKPVKPPSLEGMRMQGQAKV